MPFQLPRFEKSWFAIHVKPRAERTVSMILENKGYEHFVPTPSPRSIKKAASTSQPLFPGYVFCRFGSNVLGPIVTTPGVIRILGSGSVPIPISDTEIDAIRTVVKSGVTVDPHPYFRTGDLVRISDGPLRGVQGRITECGKRNLLVLSVDLLQRSIAVEVSPYCVQPLSSQVSTNPYKSEGMI